ncbi:chemotaxis protein CheA [Cohnella endophytica]|uniref:Chemotaxis protein CheA n=1 Tax=Cohnella endophytica TaxID=2419778 RepID=A0A494X9C9_9BACL|nr:chemotaxis protein CheA [Cohnella endophytica]RKP47357.1 chemotaxis protein CheA [Cohnella endophytica]
MNRRDLTDPLLEMYIYETFQLLERIETVVLDSEAESAFSPQSIDEIFRNVHTIKGSAAMMQYVKIAEIGHAIEDLFHFIRADEDIETDFRVLSGLVFRVVDFIKAQVGIIARGEVPNGNPELMITDINLYLSALKQSEDSRPTIAYRAVVRFQDHCQMENVRAYNIIHRLKEISESFNHDPQDLLDDSATVEDIRENGFRIRFHTDKEYEHVHRFFMQTAFLEEFELMAEDAADEAEDRKISVSLPFEAPGTGNDSDYGETKGTDVSGKPDQARGGMVSVNVGKLDKLMDLVGELVIAEAMLTSGDSAGGLGTGSYSKANGHLRKITNELQDVVMSIRMVPLATTFHKMRRVARDMCRKLNKEAEIRIVGEETELDKSIIDQISDPLMHLVRNAIDHGIEPEADRIAQGKPGVGVITLEAKNSGGDVEIIVRDDGKGLNRERILERAFAQGLISNPLSEISDNEAYGFIFQPGFSTKDQVTEFSGRGVGMDVVSRNVEGAGGTISVESKKSAGSSITMKIPLTLAIIDGMNVRVGDSRFTLPTASILESFRPKPADVITDPDGNEMIMLRGACYPILRLHEKFNCKKGETLFDKGIFVMLEQDGRKLCLFVDELLGQQQVVVKSLPGYIKQMARKEGISGCALLGDGSISLIVDVGDLPGMNRSRNAPSFAYAR